MELLILTLNLDPLSWDPGISNGILAKALCHKIYNAHIFLASG